jgi:hypothetical protein
MLSSSLATSASAAPLYRDDYRRCCPRNNNNNNNSGDKKGFVVVNAGKTSIIGRRFGPRNATNITSTRNRAILEPPVPVRERSMDDDDDEDDDDERRKASSSAATSSSPSSSSKSGGSAKIVKTDFLVRFFFSLSFFSLSLFLLSAGRESLRKRAWCSVVLSFARSGSLSLFLSFPKARALRKMMMREKSDFFFIFAPGVVHIERVPQKRQHHNANDDVFSSSHTHTHYIYIYIISI